MSKLLRNSVVIAGTPDTSTEIRHIPGNNRQTTTVGDELANIQNNLADYYDSTATYVEGDIFNYNGRLVKAILDIDPGDPLVENTNIEYTNISNIFSMTDVLYDVSNLSVAQDTFYDTGITFDSVKNKYKYLVIQMKDNNGSNDYSYHDIVYILNSTESQFLTEYHVAGAALVNNTFYAMAQTVRQSTTLQVRLDIVGYTGYTIAGVKVIGVR